MKRFMWIPLVLLMLVSLACSFSGLLPGSDSEEAMRPTSPFEVTVEATEEAEVEEINDLYDDFGRMDDSWSDVLVVTTQAKPGGETSDIAYEEGKVVFKLLANETYAYRFFQNKIGPDVVLETKYQAFGQINNGIALVCRVNAERTSWYEFHLSSTNLWNIYRYDKARRDEGKNPYVNLKSGGADIKTLFPTRENVIRATCDGSTLTLGANGVELASIQDGELTEGEYAGIGARSTDILPVSIKFDYFSMELPE